MMKRNSDEDYTSAMDNPSDTVLDMTLGDTADRDCLLDIGSCINAIQEKIDIAYGNLCRILHRLP